MSKPRILVFASGTPESGGSGFENLVHATQAGSLYANIVAVVSNHEEGGVRMRADRLGIPCVFFPPPWSGEYYTKIVNRFGVDFFALSGWLKRVEGLDPKVTFNIHPGPLPQFGGKGMHGHHIHEAVIAAYQRGEIAHSAVSMHYVTQEFDQGPLFFELCVPITSYDTPSTLAQKVNRLEHEWQPEITNLVVQGQIYWDGTNPATLVCPDGYQIRRHV